MSLPLGEKSKPNFRPWAITKSMAYAVVNAYMVMSLLNCKLEIRRRAVPSFQKNYNSGLERKPSIWLLLKWKELMSNFSKKSLFLIFFQTAGDQRDISSALIAWKYGLSYLSSLWCHVNFFSIFKVLYALGIRYRFLDNIYMYASLYTYFSIFVVRAFCFVSHLCVCDRSGCSHSDNLTVKAVTAKHFIFLPISPAYKPLSSVTLLSYRVMRVHLIDKAIIAIYLHMK